MKSLPKIQFRVTVLMCAAACLMGTKAIAATDSHHASAAMAKAHDGSVLRSMSVTEWFKKYDRIRRNAEIRFVDKLQSLRLGAAKPEKTNAALASRMMKKYAIALSEMRELQSIPETKELQEGYIEYFLTANKLFADYRAAQDKVPFTNRSLLPLKKTLEELDKKNKKLDAALRQKYAITKHKHS